MSVAYWQSPNGKWHVEVILQFLKWKYTRDLRERVQSARDVSNLRVSSRVSNMIITKKEKYSRYIRLLLYRKKQTVKPDFTGYF